MKKLFITFIISLFVAPLTLADTTSDILTELEAAGIQFVYVISKEPALENLTIVQTNNTVDALQKLITSGRLDDLPSSINVKVASVAATLQDATAARKLEERRRDRQED